VPTLGRATNWNLASKTRLALPIIAVAVLAAGACSGSGQPSVAIEHVSVIDVVSGATRSDNTVIVTGNRIVYAGPAANANVPSGARVLDGRGKFLIPGLWDMHVHAFVWVFSDFAGPLMLANGVTGARDMGYFIDTTLRWKRDIAAGNDTGPRLVVGVRVDGPVGRARFVSHVTTETDAIRAALQRVMSSDCGVVRDADTLNVLGLAMEIHRLRERAHTTTPARRTTTTTTGTSTATAG